MLLATFQSSANTEKWGADTIHYSAFASTFLTPEVAKNYEVQRSRYSGIINISVVDADTSKGLTVAIDGDARNLLGHHEKLKFREIIEGDAVYYIAEIKYRNEETYKFEVALKRPDGSSHTLKFQYTFYTN